MCKGDIDKGWGPGGWVGWGVEGDGERAQAGRGCHCTSCRQTRAADARYRVDSVLIKANDETPNVQIRDERKGLTRPPSLAPLPRLTCHLVAALTAAHGMAGAGRPSAAGAEAAPSPRELMPPPPPRAPASALLLRAPPPPRVLEEDEYTMYLEEIIERDFFPELPRLKNRLDWLEATRSGDPERIRAAQLRIQVRNAAASLRRKVPTLRRGHGAYRSGCLHARLGAPWSARRPWARRCRGRARRARPRAAMQCKTRATATLRAWLRRLRQPPPPAARLPT